MDGLPGLGSGAGVEGVSAAKVCDGFGVDAEVDDACLADELETEAGVTVARVLDRIKEEREAVRHFEAGVDCIASEGTDAFGTICNMGLVDGLAILKRLPVQALGAPMKTVARLKR